MMKKNINELCVQTKPSEEYFISKQTKGDKIIRAMFMSPERGTLILRSYKLKATRT